MSRLGEWIFRRLTSEPTSPSTASGTGYVSDDADGYSKISFFLPYFRTVIKGCRVLDHGCGTGRQAVAMASDGATEVVGVDIQESLLQRAGERAAECGCEDTVRFRNAFTPELEGRFDVALSHNAMEHYTHPRRALDDIHRALKPRGIAVFVWGPPWLHPYGSHLHYLTRLPWPHLLFSEETVMSVRRDYKNDGARRYGEIEGGLNKMTLSRFKRLANESGFRIARLSYRSVLGIPIVAHVPFLRELFIGDVFAILQRT